MIGKLKVLVPFGIGYVLGAHAGRERYEQIAGMAKKVQQDPRVQAGVAKAEETVREQAPVVKEKVAGAATAAAEKAHVGGSHTATSHDPQPPTDPGPNGTRVTGGTGS